MGDPSHVDDTAAATDATTATIACDAARYRRSQNEYLKEAFAINVFKVLYNERFRGDVTKIARFLLVF